MIDCNDLSYYCNVTLIIVCFSRVGVPEELKVSISNVNHENFSIKLLSLSLSSMDENDQFFSFHPAFFQKNVSKK